MALLDIIFIPLIFYAGHLIVDKVVVSYNIASHRALLIRLFYYHILFSLIFALYVTIYGGDSRGYWNYPERFLAVDGSWIQLHQTGTRFIYFLTYPFAQVLGISYLAGTLLFSLFGFAGFIFIYLTMMKFMTVNPEMFGVKLIPLALFFPNMHFWSGGVGKDSIMFFATCLFIFSLTNPAKNIPGIIISFYLAYFIRPHIALLMLVGFGFGLLLSTKGVSFFLRIVFLCSSLYIFFLISGTVFEFIGVEENLESFEDISTIRSKNLSRGNVGSGIDISNYSVPMKIGTFLFRPLFFDAGNLFGIIVSLENLVYVLMGLSLLRFKNLIEILRMPLHLKAALAVLGSAVFFMSSSLSNLGIIIRQKNMVMFMFVLIVLHLLGKRQEQDANIAAGKRARIRPEANAQTA